MDFNNFDTFFVYLVFLLPGFVIQSIINTVSPVNELDSENVYLTYISHTVFYYAIFGLPIKHFLKANEQNQIILTGPLLLFIFVSTVLWGVILALLVQKRLLNIALEKINIKTIDPTPSAWETCFYRNQVFWLDIKLVDGETIVGKFASNSAASSRISERDLFLECIYNQDEQGNLKSIPKNHGVWINANQIAYIVFLEGDDKDG